VRLPSAAGACAGYALLRGAAEALRALCGGRDALLAQAEVCGEGARAHGHTGTEASRVALAHAPHAAAPASRTWPSASSSTFSAGARKQGRDGCISAASLSARPCSRLPPRALAPPRRTGLEVAVRPTQPVQVPYGQHELGRVVARHVLREAAQAAQVEEQLAAQREVHDQEELVARLRACGCVRVCARPEGGDRAEGGRCPPPAPRSAPRRHSAPGPPTLHACLEGVVQRDDEGVPRVGQHAPLRDGVLDLHRHSAGEGGVRASARPQQPQPPRTCFLLTMFCLERTFMASERPALLLAHQEHLSEGALAYDLRQATGEARA